MPYYRAYPMGALGMGCPDGCVGYELTANLDFDTDDDGDVDSDDEYWNDGDGWIPLGDEDDPFAATFDGNRHTVANLFINREDTGLVGLFGRTRFGSESIVRRVGMIDADVTGDYAVGALVGSNWGTVELSYAIGSVSGESTVGGLVGYNPGVITRSYAAGSVSGEGTDSWGVGGLAGRNFNWIGGSYAAARVSGVEAVGGLVGRNGNFIILNGRTGGTITASYATGAVTGQDYVGGLAGYNSTGTIVASYATGSVSGTGEVGGLVGNSDYEAAYFSSYWDVETSGVRVGVGSDDANDNGLIDSGESQSIPEAGRSTSVCRRPRTIPASTGHGTWIWTNGPERTAVERPSGRRSLGLREHHAISSPVGGPGR